MKKAVTVALILISINIKAQLEVKEKSNVVEYSKVKAGGLFYYSIDYMVTDKDTLYSLCFKDKQYTEITEIKCINFSGEDNTFNNFYNLLAGMFSDENKAKKENNNSFTLGKSDIYVSGSKQMFGYVLYLYAGKSYTTFVKKDLDKLFKKKS